jgi:serine/threonine protein phosphatase 1
MTYTPKYDTEIRPGDVLACGDVHGRSDLLDVFLDYVKNTQTTIILLGDLIDRGPNCAGVLDRVKTLLDDPESWGLQAFYCLMGNHERMMLDANEGRLNDIMLWMQNGGNECNQLERIMPHATWIANLPFYMTIGDTLFVHAGIHPGEDPAPYTRTRTLREQLLWMRSPFLQKGPMFSLWNPRLRKCVHGHTPYLDDARIGTVNVSVTGDRIGIDTAACYSGILTSYNATKNTFQKFTVEGEGV